MEKSKIKMKRIFLSIPIILIAFQFSFGHKSKNLFPTSIEFKKSEPYPVLSFGQEEVVEFNLSLKSAENGLEVQKMKVVQCWDDSFTTDIPLISLLRKYNAKATFNLIPMDERKRTAVKKMKQGNKVIFSFLPKDKTFDATFKVEHLASNEMPEIYNGFTVAVHCRIPLGDSLKESRERLDILKKAKDWVRRDFGQEECGFVYPGGNYSQSAMEDIKKAGFLYARTIKDEGAPLSLSNPMALSTSCHWTSPQFWEKYEEAKSKGGVFYFWGHSCELGDDPELWSWLESIYQRISADREVAWYDVIDLFHKT